jgi:hypothetical protein
MSHKPMGLDCLLQGWLYFMYLEGMRCLDQTHPTGESPVAGSFLWTQACTFLFMNGKQLLCWRTVHNFDNKLNCWVLHPVARVSTNAFLKTTVRNNVSVLYFIVHYLLHVSAPIGGHPQVIRT